MKKDELRIFGKYYDQIYLKRKNYQAEADTISRIIRKFEKKPSKRLLDVGCGTGEHLKYLSQHFKCKGIDINRDMIETARTKVPNTEFEIANMIDFKLKERFDVITCLFSSIGYVQNMPNLTRTFRNFNSYLNDEGLVITEPWVFKKDFRKGMVAIDTYEDDKVKLVRMATSKLMKSQWLVLMHYLIGADGEIKHVNEVHRMLAADYNDYIKAFKSAKFSKTRFLEDDLWTRCRGLFVATK